MVARVIDGQQPVVDILWVDKRILVYKTTCLYSAFISIVHPKTESVLIFLNYFWKNGQKNSKCEEIYISRFQETFWKQENHNQGGYADFRKKILVEKLKKTEIFIFIFDSFLKKRTEKIKKRGNQYFDVCWNFLKIGESYSGWQNWIWFFEKRHF